MTASIEVGAMVRVKPPFVLSFSGVYRVCEPPELQEGDDPHPDGLVWLEGVPGAWSPEHLGVA